MLVLLDTRHGNAISVASHAASTRTSPRCETRAHLRARNELIADSKYPCDKCLTNWRSRLHHRSGRRWLYQRCMELHPAPSALPRRTPGELSLLCSKDGCTLFAANECCMQRPFLQQGELSASARSLRLAEVTDMHDASRGQRYSQEWEPLIGPRMQRHLRDSLVVWRLYGVEILYSYKPVNILRDISLSQGLLERYCRASSPS